VIQRIEDAWLRYLSETEATPSVTNVNRRFYYNRGGGGASGN